MCPQLFYPSNFYFYCMSENALRSMWPSRTDNRPPVSLQFIGKFKIVGKSSFHDSCKVTILNGHQRVWPLAFLFGFMCYFCETREEIYPNGCQSDLLLIELQALFFIFVRFLRIFCVFRHSTHHCPYQINRQRTAKRRPNQIFSYLTH